MKECDKCFINKPLSDFPSRIALAKSTPSDYKSTCKKCSNEYHMKYNKDNKVIKKIVIRRRQFLQDLKIKHGCCICKYNKCYRSLHFHHVDPAQKLFDFGQLTTQSAKAISEELSKCVIVCANCHGEIEHGLYKHDLTMFLVQTNPQDFLLDADKYKSHFLSKEELEKLVWELPIVKICELHQVSSKCIYDHCRKLNIKLPPRNYFKNKLCKCGKKILDNSIQCHACAAYKGRKFDIPKEELEKLVWEKPMTHIGKDYGVSDKAVAKRCKVLGINTPSRGYWVKNK